MDNKLYYDGKRTVFAAAAKSFSLFCEIDVGLIIATIIISVIEMKTLFKQNKLKGN